MEDQVNECVAGIPNLKHSNNNWKYELLAKRSRTMAQINDVQWASSGSPFVTYRAEQAHGKMLVSLKERSVEIESQFKRREVKREQVVVTFGDHIDFQLKLAAFKLKAEREAYTEATKIDSEIIRSLNGEIE